MKSSDLMVKALENEGVEYIFGIPGEENLDFLNSLIGSKIQLILTCGVKLTKFVCPSGKPKLLWTVNLLYCGKS